MKKDDQLTQLIIAVQRYNITLPLQNQKGCGLVVDSEVPLADWEEAEDLDNADMED
jgi:hypothetical protein